MYDFSEIYNRQEFLKFLNTRLPLTVKEEDIDVKIKLLKSIKKIAHVNFDESVPIFEVEHSSKNDPRIELTKNLFSILNNFSIKTALAVFFCKDSKKYRFSLIESSLKWSSDTTVKREFSDPKRLSYLLGEGAKIHTPTNLFKNKIKNFKDLRSRFDKEVVTKEFFENYKRLFIDLNKHLENDKNFKKFAKNIKLSIPVFAKKLMGQIVFCYFLQKKNWLGAKKNTSLDQGDSNFLRNKFLEILRGNKNFFNDLLEPLFYLGLNTENQNSYCEAIDCKIPYLNGGLFEPIENYDWEREDLNIPNDIFSNDSKTGILDIFDLYNFTVDEHEDLDVDLAIDPEMLGNVFEKLLDVEKREEQGTYYTPKEIAVYMCRISIINYLKKNLNINDDLSFYELFEKDSEIKNLKEYSKKIDELLKEILICDPCVGSGAFPVTMMNEVTNARYKIKYHTKNSNLKNNELYELKKYFIQNNIYGVDIEPGAVEISKLRLWLSLIVDASDINKIDTLPNLDYKIMQGDSLIDEYYGISFEENKDDLLGSDVELENIINDLQKKQNEYFSLKYTKSKFNKRKEVQNSLKNILNYVLEEQKKKLNFKKNKKTSSDIEQIEKNINELSNTYAIRDFFFWKLFFSKVFKDKGGFDVIIANPPYVFTRDVQWSESYKKFIIKKYLFFSESFSSGRVQTNKINLYIVFLILGLKLINENGNSCFIVPNNILRNVIHQNFRNFLLHNSDIDEIADLKANAFIGVTTSPIIMLTNKNTSGEKNIKITDTNFAEYKSVDIKQNHSISQSNLKSNPFNVFNIFSKSEDLKVISKIRHEKTFIKNIRKHAIAGIDANNELIHEGKSGSNFREFIRGGDIKKFRIEYNNEYIEYDRDKINRARPDELWRAKKKIFTQRISGGKHPLVCAVDDRKLLGYASTNVLLLFPEFEAKYSYELLSVIINSKLINYFYAKSFSNSSELTVNISTSYLEEIPIPKINTNNKSIIKDIEKKYEKIITDNKDYETSVFDDLIYELYGLTKKEILIIDKHFNH